MLTIGEHSDVDRDGLLLCNVEAVIGRYTSIGGRTRFSNPPQHHKEFVTTKALTAKGGGFYKDGITIGNDVWIGQDCVILGGAVIGDGAVIGQDSVVAGTIPPYSVAWGNRADVKYMRFTETQIVELLKIKWWDWPEEKIAENAEALCSDDIDGFIERFR